MAESTSSSEKPKRRRRTWLIVLIVLVAVLVAGAFKIHLLKIPKCSPEIQEEVDWPPQDPGIYEEASHNRLRTLEQGGFSPPGTVSLCGVAQETPAHVVASAPTSPRFLVMFPNQQNWEYQFYQQVEVPETGECVRVRVANQVAGLEVTPDAQNPSMVWVRPPQALENGQTYMLTAGQPGSSDPAAVVRGVIVRPGQAAQ